MTELSKHTIAKYERCVRIFNTKYPGVDTKNPENVIKALKSDYKESSIRCFLSAFHDIYRKKGDAATMKLYSAIISKKIKEELDETSKQELTETEKENYLTWDEILKAAIAIQADPKVSDEYKLIVSFYTLLPPVRLDYARLKIYATKPDEDVGNYLVYDKADPFIKINEHKTAKAYGAIVHKMPEALRTQFMDYLAKNPKRTTLFDVSELTFGKRIFAIFQKQTGKRIGVNILRHAFVSKFRDGEKPYVEKIGVAKAMGHSVAMQEMYRRIPAGGAGATD